MIRGKDVAWWASISTIFGVAVSIAAWLWPDPVRNLPLGYLSSFDFSLLQNRVFLAVLMGVGLFGIGVITTSVYKYLRLRRIRRALSRIPGRAILSDGKTLIVGTVRQSHEAQDSFPKKVFFDIIPWGQTMIELRATVTFSYYIDLSDEGWDFERVGDKIEVKTPPIKPILPPTIHPGIERTVKNSGSGSQAFESLTRLERQIADDLEGIAYALLDDPDVKEECKKGVELFLRNWMYQEASLSKSITMFIRLHGE
jgi:hypothetical protein